MNFVKKLIGFVKRVEMMKIDEHFIALALREAEKGMYTAHPNPRVGCLLVNNNRIVGRGFHLRTGTAHAEANALLEAGAKARNSTAYVTLEPCSFTGRTPSCADALIHAGVKRVVFAMADPHPKNRGLGLNKLRAAGIEVTGPVLEASARLLNPGHVQKFEKGLPFVRLKLAMSMDGKTALANGKSQWITGEAARRDVQRLRARSSAIVTGVQTVIDDDPSLTVRAGELDVKESRLASEVERFIVVLDPEKRIPVSAKLLNNPNTILATLEDPANSKKLPVTQIRLPDDGARRIDLRALLLKLASMDCNEVLFECGANLAGSLINDRLVDEIIIYMAPKLMGQGARSLMNINGLTDMRDVPGLEFTDVRNLDGDLRITATLNTRGLK
jgi:diaminohydroxyphosphoribosylaminopyrimidine deaminase/5-amino-6-(5-phosphoribosylamino)uracil reductase